MVNFENGIVYFGNASRLRRAMARGAAGEKLTVGFLGGSITQGSFSSTPETCYAYLVYKWWAERFSDVRYINAGIGGTTSQFGVARVGEDLLRYQPDVVFIEFSVNDDNTPHFMETYEGLVRQVLKSGAAVVLIHNVCYDTGFSAEEIHLRIGKHYDLPCVSIKASVYPEIAAGRIPNRKITPDDLHPNDAGHALVADAVKHLLNRVQEQPDREEAALPAPLTGNQYENSVRYQNHNSTPVLRGFVPDDTPQEHITQMFRRGFTAWNAGDSITFDIESTGIAVQYRKSVKKPAPIAKVTVDGDEASAVILDAIFQEDWGDCLYIDTVLAHGAYRRRRVEIRIIESHPEDRVPFYLVSVIGSKGEDQYV